MRRALAFVKRNRDAIWFGTGAACLPWMFLFVLNEGMDRPWRVAVLLSLLVLVAMLTADVLGMIRRWGETDWDGRPDYALLDSMLPPDATPEYRAAMRELLPALKNIAETHHIRSTGDYINNVIKIEIGNAHVLGVAEQIALEADGKE